MEASLRAFTVDKNNDLTLSPNGNLGLSEGLQAVLFSCEQVAKAQLNEMVLATDKGMPNFQTVWVGAPNIRQFEAYLISRLQSVQDVTRVTSLQATVSGGVLSYTASIQTIYGEGTING